MWDVHILRGFNNDQLPTTTLKGLPIAQTPLQVELHTHSSTRPPHLVYKGVSVEIYERHARIEVVWDASVSQQIGRYKARELRVMQRVKLSEIDEDGDVIIKGKEHGGDGKTIASEWLLRPCVA